MIQATDLRVDRGRRRVLDGVNLMVRAGECVVVVGPNGAGKTTLLQALLGLLPPTGGRIVLHDRPLARWSRRAIARIAAYVAQTHEGYMGFRVREVVEAARYAYVSAWGRAGEDDLRAVETALRACDASDLTDRRLSALSSGERQKVWLAAALAQGSPLLMLDEPTTALDPRHQAELIALLRRLSAEGKTLLLVSHDLDLASWLGGRVLALRGGTVAYDGPAGEFLHERVLRAVFDADFVLQQTPGAPLPTARLTVP